MGVQKKARGGGGIRPCKTHEDFWSEMQLLNLTSRSAAAAGCHWAAWRRLQSSKVRDVDERWRRIVTLGSDTSGCG